MMKSSLFWLCVVASAMPRLGYCRWSTESDAAAAIDWVSEEFEVNSDGTYRETFEEQTEILKDQARRDRGARRLTYNASAGSFKLLQAEVINGQEKQAVDSAMIEEKPLASQGAGFDQINQVLVAFPEIKIGSKTHLRFVRKIKEVPFAGFFSKRFHLDGGALTRSASFKIVSDLPLYIETHDPGHALSVRESRAGEKYQLEVTLTKPVFESVADEEAPSLLSSERTWIVVSSTRSHAEMIRGVLPKYEEILDSPLPEAFERIRAAAATYTGVVDRINAVTAALAQRVRYMGDWRTVSGGFVPRPLATVAKTEFGDCKDFATVTAAILRKLGMTAEVAWVERDAQPDPLPGLPLGEAFNHAILRAKAEGKTYWVDPTNFQSFSQGIFPDIIGRQSVVLSKGSDSPVDTIPAGRPEESLYDERFTVDFDRSGEADFDVQMKDAGRMALSMTGASLHFSKESLDHRILTSFVRPSHLKESKVADYDLSSRIVKDLEFSFRVKTRNTLARTSAGLGYQLPTPTGVDALINLETSKRASGYFAGQPITFKREYTLRRIRVVGKQYRGCDIHSPWMDVRREFSFKSSGKDPGLLVKEGYEVKQARISNADLKTQAFSDFQDRLQKCFDRVQIVFEPQAASRTRVQ